MNIFNIQNDYCYNSHRNSAYGASRSMNHSNGVSQTTSDSKDELTFSMEVMNSSEGTLPPDLEACRLPSWYAQYIPKQQIMDVAMMDQAVKETGKLHRMHDKFNPDGHISNNEQRILNNYRNNNMEANQALRDQRESASKYKHELSEYVEKLEFYFKDAMIEEGITQINYQEKVLQAKGDNENLHQSFKEKFLKDLKVLELMDKIGIKLPFEF